MGTRPYYDLIIIGSGPAGFQAALQASRLNKKAVIIEKHPERLGGAWIHTGTIPSKTMREVLAAIRSIHSHLGEHWVARLVRNISAGSLQGRAKTAAMDEEKIIHGELAERGIEVIHGTAYLDAARLVRITSQSGQSSVIEGEFILLATGSKPRRPPEIPFDGWRVIDSDDILTLESLPRSITVCGSGVIGCEYACIFAALGVKTYIVDTRPRIMQFMDLEIAEELKNTMEDLGVVFHLGQSLKHVECRGATVVSHFNDLVLETEVLFFAGGRDSCTEHLGLERVGIEVNDRKAIKVNRYFQTSVPNIYAAGDIIGPPALAGTSAEQGRLACAHAFGLTHTKFPEFFPIGVYTIPEMSSVGRTEEELQNDSAPYVVGRARYNQIARGHIRGDNHGLMKILVCTKTSKILGVHIVGADAANLIHIGQCCMIAEMTVHDMVNSIIFNFPTLAEGYKIAAFDALSQMEGGKDLRDLLAFNLKATGST